MHPYPLLFEPILIPKVWGGRLLETLGRSLPAGDEQPFGESWELVDVPEVQSVIANGPAAGKTIGELRACIPASIIGDLKSGGTHGGFPLLIKYLHAADNLSIQVHPTEDQSQADPTIIPKHEAWYILRAEPGSLIYKGLKENTTCDDIRSAIRHDTLPELMLAVPARAGDCHYLPAGTCHALGAGVLLAEIQTPSTITYRLWDWGRTERDLHLDEALDCVHLGPPDVSRAERKTHVGGVFVTVSKLCTCPFFTIEKVRMSEGYGQEIPYDRPAVWIVLQGGGVISGLTETPGVRFRQWDVLLIPTGMGPAARVDLDEDTVWLDVQFPRSATRSGDLLA